MGFIGGSAGYWLLRAIAPRQREAGCEIRLPEPRATLDTLIGSEIWRDIVDKVVIDFGCGRGSDAIEVAERGARMVVGIDIRDRMLDAATTAAKDAGVSERCVFARETHIQADVIVSVDAFEHFRNPAEILQVMSTLLKPGGTVWISFGPPWYHPRGGHLFSVFPWAHLLFTENALIRWRSNFKTDGASRFSEVEGGLNQMSIARFRRLVAASPFRFEQCVPIPIRALRFFANPLTQEFVTSSVRCKLVLRDLPLCCQVAAS